MKFSIKDFFSTCDQNPKETADLVTFTEKVFSGKFNFLCSEGILNQQGEPVFLYHLHYKIPLTPISPEGIDRSKKRSNKTFMHVWT